MWSTEDAQQQSHHNWTETYHSELMHCFGGEINLQCITSHVIFTTHLSMEVAECVCRNVGSVCPYETYSWCAMPCISKHQEAFHTGMNFSDLLQVDTSQVLILFTNQQTWYKFWGTLLCVLTLGQNAFAHWKRDGQLITQIWIVIHPFSGQSP